MIEASFETDLTINLVNLVCIFLYGTTQRIFVYIEINILYGAEIRKKNRKKKRKIVLCYKYLRERGIFGFWRERT